MVQELTEYLEELLEGTNYGSSDYGPSDDIVLQGDDVNYDAAVDMKYYAHEDVLEALIEDDRVAVHGVKCHDGGNVVRIYLFDTDKRFTTFLRDEIFTKGTYTIEERDGGLKGDARVAERPNGSGHIMYSDMERALKSDDVSIVTVTDGWLRVEDAR